MNSLVTMLRVVTPTGRSASRMRHGAERQTRHSDAERRNKIAWLKQPASHGFPKPAIMHSMPIYDLCLAWNWDYDADFARLLEAACAAHDMALLQIHPSNLEAARSAIEMGETRFRCLLDRAADTDARFQSLVDRAQAQGIPLVNPPERSRRAWDKATMHLEFLSRGLETPHTLILPPYREQPGFPLPDLSPLRGRFAIKPAIGGGGEGVVLEASTWEQVGAARQQFPAEKYLLQAHVSPRSLDQRPAWFRVLYCNGAVYPCWWDQSTHGYVRVTAEERSRFGLRELYETPRRIAALCGLHLFSTEIALTDAGQFSVVDYVNDPLDLRLQSKAADGVPDAIVENIASRLARLAGSFPKNPV